MNRKQVISLGLGVFVLIVTMVLFVSMNGSETNRDHSAEAESSSGSNESNTAIGAAARSSNRLAAGDTAGTEDKPGSIAEPDTEADPTKLAEGRDSDVASVGGESGKTNGKDDPADNPVTEEEKENRKIRCTVHGVVSFEGKPRAGVDVFISGWGHPEGSKSTRTDENGYYEFEDLRKFLYSVSVRMPNAFRHGEYIECNEDNPDIQADLDLKPASVHVYGLVTDHEDNPLAHCGILVLNVQNENDMKKELNFPVDANGKFEFWLAERASDSVVAARAIGHMSQAHQVPKGQSEVELRFRLKRGSTIHGTVVSPEGPAAKALLGYRYKADAENTTGGMAKADEKGNFVIAVGPGEVDIAAWDGKLWGYTKVPERKEATDAHDVVIKLGPGRTVTGHVQLENGKPVALAQVIFSCDEIPLGTIIQADIEGNFKIEGLPPGKNVHFQPVGDKRSFGKRGVDLPPDQSHVTVVMMP
jgi:hypothetical protein